MDTDWEYIERNWHQLRDMVAARWALLSDEDFDAIAGKREELVGRLQERYGMGRATAEREVEEFHGLFDRSARSGAE